MTRHPQRRHRVPDWQRRAVGHLVYANATGTGGWYVMDVRPNEALVLKMGNLVASRPMQRDELLKWEFLWSIVVKERHDGTSRLFVRERVGFGSGVTRVVMSPLDFVSFVMTQKMLRGIKARAEDTAQGTSSPVRFMDKAVSGGR